MDLREGRGLDFTEMGVMSLTGWVKQRWAWWLSESGKVQDSRPTQEPWKGIWEPRKLATVDQCDELISDDSETSVEAPRRTWVPQGWGWVTGKVNRAGRRVLVSTDAVIQQDLQAVQTVKLTGKIDLGWRSPGLVKWENRFSRGTGGETEMWG